MNNILKLFIGGFIAVGSVTCCVADTTDTDNADGAVTDVAEDTAGTQDLSVGTQTVSARMDCKTIKAKIDELSAGGASDELSRLQSQYRRDCVVRASGLRSSYRGGALTVPVASATTAMVSMASAKIEPAEKSADTKEVSSENKSAPENVEISAAQTQMCERLPGAIESAADDTKDALQSAFDEYCKVRVAAPDAVVKMTMTVLGPAENVADNVAENVETDEEKYARIAANLDAGLCPDGTQPNKFGCCAGEVFKEIGNLEFACCPTEGGECFPPVK